MKKTLTLLLVLTALLCFNVSANISADDVMSNIVDRYSDAHKLVKDGNLPWLIADLKTYEATHFVSLYSEKEEQLLLDAIIEFADNSTKPADLSKSIIALRSMGYDANYVQNRNRKLFSPVEKLQALVDEKASTVTNIYTLPYVILALHEYATDEEIEFMIDSAVLSKESWQKTTWGTDGLCPMVQALSLYSDRADVKEIIDESIEIIYAEQEDTGLIKSFGPAASTGLAMAAFSAAGIDSNDVVCGENSIVDGIMTLLDENESGFLPSSNSFSTEQGFRGLVSIDLIKSGKVLYDFSENSMFEAFASVDGKRNLSRYVISDTSAEDEEEDDVYQPEASESEESTEEPEKVDDVNEYVNPFDDVANDSKYFEAIKLVNTNGIMMGVGGSFLPENNITRAEAATIFYRLAKGEKTETSLIDISADAWYYDSVSWAVNCGIMNGVGNGYFAPMENVTRQMAATILFRYLKPDFKASVTSYNDVNELASWGKDAMIFAVENGYLEIDDNNLSPNELLTRADVAFLISKLIK